MTTVATMDVHVRVKAALKVLKSGAVTTLVSARSQYSITAPIMGDVLRDRFPISGTCTWEHKPNELIIRLYEVPAQPADVHALRTKKAVPSVPCGVIRAPHPASIDAPDTVVFKEFSSDYRLFAELVNEGIISKVEDLYAYE